MEAHGLLFCKDCNNFLFLKNVKNDEGTVTDMIYYCKKCGFTHTNNNKKILYDVTYNSDATSKYLYNDYLKYDPTIPHLKSMYCVNPNCASNLPCKYSITFKYYPDGTGDLSVPQNMEQMLNMTLNNELSDEVRNLGLLVKSIAANTYYAIITTTTDAHTNKDYMKAMNEVLEYLHNKKMDRTGINSSDEEIMLKNKAMFTNIEGINENTNDVLFIKYDALNMKYLYKCCVCSTSWKNKE
jgi:DNA-directed RNA polymerase subunit M/transcription elongation factor TFIIS